MIPIRSSAWLLAAFLGLSNICPLEMIASREVQEVVIPNPWKGKKVAFLGDSITDEIHVGTEKNYWQYLQEFLGLEPMVYGKNGHQWTGVEEQAKKMLEERGDAVDAILIFAGTNDYNDSTPLGEWYTTQEETVVAYGGKEAVRAKRTATMSSQTFRGRINRVMSYLKAHYPTKQIIILTPIHRSYARFSENNVQQDEAYPNALGLYINDYVEVLKEAANVWAVPVIDLNSICGLYPSEKAHSQYFHNEQTDRLHPNAAGHRRMAKALMYQLLSYPADFD